MYLLLKRSVFGVRQVLLMTLQNAPPGLDYERDKKFSKVRSRYEIIWSFAYAHIWERIAFSVVKYCLLSLFSTEFRMIL